MHVVSTSFTRVSCVALGVDSYCHLQVAKKASSLNSSDVFVLCEKDEVAIWYGRHGSKDERADGQGSWGEG